MLMNYIGYFMPIEKNYIFFEIFKTFPAFTMSKLYKKVKEKF